MNVYDFEYDGITLKSMGFMVCSFDTKEMETISNGSQLTLNTVSTLHGAKHEFVSAEYGECIEATFQICKDLCTTEDMEISVSDLRRITRWLNRKGFYRLRFIDDEGYIDLSFNASFNISKIEVGGILHGLELTMKTDSPFARKLEREIVLDYANANETKIFQDTSDEIGYIYPKTEITLKSSGNLTIYNAIEDRTTFIKNCSAGEVLTFDYPIISTSSTRNLANDFNWTFFRIANDFSNDQNKVTASLPCTIKLVYEPIVKVGI